MELELKKEGPKMLVKDLIEILKDANPEAKVIVSKDAEGNNYSPLEGVEKGHYISEAAHFGDFHSDETAPKFHCFAVCLVPLM
jgi:hypothetical protein